MSRPSKPKWWEEEKKEHRFMPKKGEEEKPQKKFYSMDEIEGAVRMENIFKMIRMNCSAKYKLNLIPRNYLQRKHPEESKHLKNFLKLHMLLKLFPDMNIEDYIRGMFYAMKKDIFPNMFATKWSIVAWQRYINKYKNIEVYKDMVENQRRQNPAFLSEKDEKFIDKYIKENEIKDIWEKKYSFEDKKNLSLMMYLFLTKQITHHYAIKKEKFLTEVRKVLGNKKFKELIISKIVTASEQEEKDEFEN